MKLSDVRPAPEIFQNPAFFRVAPDSDGKLRIKYADAFFVPARFIPASEKKEEK